MAALPSRQRDQLYEWLGAWEVVADCSWPLQSTTVLRVRAAAALSGAGRARCGPGPVRPDMAAYAPFAAPAGGLARIIGAGPALTIKIIDTSNPEGILTSPHKTGHPHGGASR